MTRGFPAADRERWRMTKADLVEEVVRVSNVSKKHAEIIVNTVFSSIIEALQQDDKIELRGFGSFRVRRRRSRQGRNPKTGDRVEVPEKRIPYFKPGKELKDLINGLLPGDPGPESAALPASPGAGDGAVEGPSES
jgi:integration host factor subunit beta